MNTVDVSDLTRQFVLRRRSRGRRRRVREVLTAVDSMSFRIESGSAVGYIGANGAGKSTTIKMLTGILVPTSGTVRTCGLDPVRRRRELAGRIGVVFGQRSQLWWDLPLRESFTILAAIHRLEPVAARRRTDELVEQLEMAHTLDTPVRQLSLGQRMRAEIAAALLHRPELLILDEPTIGLDVLSKQRLREFLRRERADSGTTLLLTTHDMGDIERLCERVLVVDHGRLAYDGTLPGLARTVGARRVLVVDLARPSGDLTGLAGATLLAAEADGMRQRLAFDPEITTAAQLLAAISNRVEVRDLSIEEPDIEDVVRRIYSAGDGTAPAPSDAGAVARGATPGDEAESAAERPGEQGVHNAAEGGTAGVEKAVQRGATGVDDDRNHASTSL
ncbi:ABC transporter ATP-binding protein [Nocardia africana]|uniref:Daunorubicin/doxorubicin resistance ATP-binding protein DrrA n=1 Tax=Nocardia africana TaxID=134964 RepID=A0A378X155_9NOCA|nr:ATP-binding cassette domain-containing protein [Nocardia africana]MCC3311570.1 ATP-binding cassette domain-containing protein [Nocardia africana]SUA47169.1 Daunorubicin/doxorubicin resistance ATP-binding protein DrrA [Nocardia africana]